MPNQYTVTSTSNIFTRLFRSVIGIGIGLVLFLASFWVLWWNEGRVDFSRIAKTAVQVSAEKPDENNNQKLIAVTGNASSTEQITEDQYIAPKDYLILRRETEMYAWIQKENQESSKSTGGSETTTTTYSYERKWVKNPSDSTNFKYPAEHTNPPKSINDHEYRTKLIRIGSYEIRQDGLTATNLIPLVLSEDVVRLPDNGSITSDGFIYIGTSTYESPATGDIRMKYYSLTPNDQVTLFGKQVGTNIESYTDTKDNTLFRIFPGNFDTAVKTMKTEYTMALWIFRFLGFFLMWLGLSFIFEPISVFLDILPMFGSLSRGLIGVITFAASLALTIVTIIIGIIFHNIVLLIGVLALCAVGVFVYSRTKKESSPLVQKAPPAQPVNPNLAAYIQQAKTAGASKESIAAELIKAGWPKDAVDQALS